MYLSVKNIDLLQETEEINQDILKSLRKKIKSDNIWISPIIIEKKSLAILDGHHRYNVAKDLKLKRVPCFIIDYFDDRVMVTSWRPDIHISKKLVLEYIHKNQKFMSKTTRHSFKVKLPESEIPLSLLF